MLCRRGIPNPKDEDGTDTPTIYIISGGEGFSGEQIVRTVLAQFPESAVPIEKAVQVSNINQLTAIMKNIKSTGGIIVHTMADESLRNILIEKAHKFHIPEIDLMGPLLGVLASALRRAPLGLPGHFRSLHADYFTRMEAIDYTLKHDDGQHPQGWIQADILLMGVSRSGKTPLSIYLSVQGWRTANYPVVPGAAVPAEISRIDPRRVFGLIIEPDKLMRTRIQRIAYMGNAQKTSYVDPAMIEEELNTARKIFRRGGFHVINMTDKTIEAGAADIIERIRQIRE